jgi:predicted transcriptional regulator
VTKPLSINWQRVVLNIRQSGMPIARLAQTVGMDDQTLRHYARGECREPRWSQALALLDVHADRCPERHRVEELQG